MARVKRGVAAKRRHKKVLEQAKGYYGNKSRSFRAANEQLLHSGQYAFRDRRARKGEFRRLWIQRINAATRQHDLSYSRFIAGLERRRHRGRPQDPRRPGRHRPGRLRRPGRRGEGGALTDTARVHQPPDPATAAPARAPQFAFRGGRVRRRGRGARRRGGRRRLGRRGPVRGAGRGAGRRGRAGARAGGRASPSGSRPPRRRRACSPSCAAARRRRRCSPAPGCVVVADRLADPGNLGTILRSAEAAGVDAVVLTPGTVDLLNPKVVRASAGLAVPRPGRAPPSSPTCGGPGCASSARRRTAAPPHTDVDWTGRLAIVARQRGPRARRRRRGRRVGAHRARRPRREPQRGDGRHRPVLRRRRRPPLIPSECCGIRVFEASECRAVNETLRCIETLGWVSSGGRARPAAGAAISVPRVNPGPAATVDAPLPESARGRPRRPLRERTPVDRRHPRRQGRGARTHRRGRHRSQDVAALSTELLGKRGALAQLKTRLGSLADGRREEGRRPGPQRGHRRGRRGARRPPRRAGRRRAGRAASRPSASTSPSSPASRRVVGPTS